VSLAIALAQILRDAARLVAGVAGGRSLADAAPAAPRGALLDLTHGTLRRYGRGPAIVGQLSRRGLPDPLVQALLWCSLYALDSGRYAQYTVVDQAVRACTLLERGGAKGYVNGLLRAYLRQQRAIEARLLVEPQARYQHPAWWIDLVHRAFPDAFEAILAAGNEHPPMTLRVNRRRSSVADYALRLEQAGLAARPLQQEALLLDRPVPVERLPGFAEGCVSIQDAGAQRAAHCIELEAGQRVLDACAAPGGKSAHMLETADIDLTALDLDAHRCGAIERNLERLGLAAAVRAADCSRLDTWWDGVPFHRILADVPCSSSGVARRHPDLKWLRRAADVPAFAARQSAILQALWRTLVPNGKLLYVTCSVFPQENEELVASFVARTPGARRLPLADGQPAQWLPGPQHDGFFYALIQKQA
jgi:16S rRNA (cytosine967-C5)-methyltransferase